MAKGRLVNQALEKLRQFDRGNTVQPGMFSTLDEAIKDAPFDVNSMEQWRKYLQPGRMVKREGVQFPLKKEELEYSLDRLGVEPDLKLSKEELQDLITQNRQGFGVTMAHEFVEEAAPRSPIPESWVEDGRQLGAEIKVDDPRYGSVYAGDTDSRLFHASPGSTYEESVTRVSGLNYRSHFDNDALSWSRTSTHNTLPLSRTSRGDMEPLAANEKVRLVEEIQSDLHSAAAEKIYTDPDTGQVYDEYQAAGVNDATKEVLIPSRIGYGSPGDSYDATIMRNKVDQLTDSAHETPHGSPAYRDIQSEIQRLQRIATRLEKKVPNAPYKNPKDYAGLELRKQLLNAVDNDENYLALTRGADQIERYSQGMNEKSVRGMEQMYDKVYLGELKKLAKRYGAVVEDVEVPVTSALDARPAAIADHGYENFGDFMAHHYETLETLGTPGAYGSDINMVRSSLEDMRSLGRQVMSPLFPRTGFPEHDVRNLEDILSRIGRRADEFDTLEISPSDRGWKEAYGEYHRDLERLHADASVMLSESYNDYVDNFAEISGQEAGVKSFPAIKLTPEVKEKILALGVPQFARGGPVRMQGGGLSVFSNLRRPDAEASEEEYEEVMANLSETEDERGLQDKMGTGEYWWDTVKHLPAMFLARMKKVNPETGEVRWLGRAPEPDLDMVARGAMTMDEWREEKTAAEEYNEAGKEFRSTWVDDTKAMAALPAMIGNVVGEYTGIGPGSLSDPEEGFQYPEFAMEAAGRVGMAERSAQDLLGVEDPEGWPQHLMGALGAMGSQVPVPGAQLRSIAAPVTQRISGAIPDAVKTLTKPVTKPLGVISEFANPFIDPSLKNYGIGATFGGALGTALEPSGEDIREMEGRQREYDDMADKVQVASTEHWDELDMDTKVSIMYSPFAMAAMENLTEEQRLEMIEVLDEMGAFNDAE